LLQQILLFSQKVPTFGGGVCKVFPSIALKN
jgi:hypothetical protein